MLSILSRSLSTYFIFDEKYPTLLRFSISSHGLVTEYRYNETHLKACERVYFRESFTQENPSLESLEQWVQRHGQEPYHQTRYEYDTKGDVTTQYQKRPGSDREVKTTFEYDLQSHVTRQTELADTEQARTTQHAYDLLSRTTHHTDALGHETQTHYLGALVRQTLPNGRVIEKQHNPFGNEQTQSQWDGRNETRERRVAQQLFDKDNIVLMTCNANNEKEIHITDPQGRLVAKIDSAGFLYWSQLDARDNLVETALYEDPKPELLLKASFSRAELNDHISSWRATSTPRFQTQALFNALDRQIFSIDEAGYVTESHYGVHGHVIAQWRYEVALTDSERRLFVDNSDRKPLETSPRRLTQYFYDNQGERIGHLQPNGALQSVSRHWHGLYEETMDYATRVDSPGEIKAALPAVSATAQDKISITLYDTWRQKIATIDAQGYLIQYVYDDAQDCVKEIHYGKKITLPEQKPFSLSTILQNHGLDPEHLTDNDVWLNNRFNGHHQVTKIEHSNGKVEELQYSELGTECSRVVYDNPLRPAVRPAFVTEPPQKRGYRQTLNAFDEVETALNSLGLDYELSRPLVTEEELKRRFATLTQYDPMGRVCQVNQPCGEKTVCYHDARGLVSFRVDAKGRITEYGYDAKGRETSASFYATAFSQTEYDALVGGQVT